MNTCRKGFLSYHNTILMEPLDSIFDFATTSASVSKGRRRRRDEPLEETNEPKTSDEPVPLGEPVTQVVSEIPQSEELPIMERSGRRGRKMWEVKEEEAVDSRLLKQESDEEETIPVIPDLEDLQEENLAGEIAAPPTAVLNELMSYRELDSDLLKQSVFQILDNEIDLKLLTKTLVPEKDTIEADDTWNMESLFAEIQSLVTTCNKGNSDQSGMEDIGSGKREVLI